MCVFNGYLFSAQNSNDNLNERIIMVHNKDGAFIHSFKTNCKWSIVKMVSYNGFLFTHHSDGTIKTWNKEYKNPYSLGGEVREFNRKMLIHNGELVVAARGEIQFWKSDTKGSLFLQRRIDLNYNYTPKIELLNGTIYVITDGELFRYSDADQKIISVAKTPTKHIGDVFSYNNKLMISNGEKIFTITP